MPLRRLVALIIALAIIGFPLTAQSADTTTTLPPVPGMTGEQIDAQAQIDALKDIPPNSWAYQSIQQLVNDGVIVGYPDGTFKGNRPMTRYEAAVMVERAVEYVTKKLATPKTAPEVSAADITALRNLLDEFRGDIDSLKIRVADIDSRLKTVQTNQTKDEAALRDTQAAAARAKFGAVWYDRAGTFNQSTAAFTNAFGAGTVAPGCAGPAATCTGAGLPLPAGTALTGGNPGANAGNQGNSNKYLAGANTQGYGYQLVRLLLDGNLDAAFNYHVRLENRIYWAAPSQQLGALNTPGGSFNTTPTFGAYPGNTAVRLNYAFMQYNDPSGFNAAAGRLNETDGTLGLLFADQWNGASLGYNKYGLNARVSYGYTYPQYDSVPNNTFISPTGGLVAPGSACATTATATTTSFTSGKCTGFTTQLLAAQLSYTINKKAMAGVAYLDDINNDILDWNPNVCSLTGLSPALTAGHAGSCLAYVGGPFVVPTAANGSAGAGAFTGQYTNLAEGSVFGRYADTFSGVPFSLEAEGSYRFGNDPNTGTTWTQPYAVWVQGKIGWYNPTPFRPYVEGGYIGAGYNALSPHTAITNGTSYDIQYQGNANGYWLAYVGLHYWFSRYGRIGVVYQASDILSGTNIPVGTANYSSAYLTRDISNGVFLQTWLQF